jgi:hypothetical protein
MSDKVSITVTKAILTRDVCTFSTMDPFFIAAYDTTSTYKSKLLNNAGKYPVWNETFVFDYTGKDHVSIDIYHEKEKVCDLLI